MVFVRSLEGIDGKTYTVVYGTGLSADGTFCSKSVEGIKIGSAVEVAGKFEGVEGSICGEGHKVGPCTEN